MKWVFLPDYTSNQEFAVHLDPQCDLEVTIDGEVTPGSSLYIYQDAKPLLSDGRLIDIDLSSQEVYSIRGLGAEKYRLEIVDNGMFGHPVFVDVDAKTYNLCPTALQQWLESEPELRRRVKAIMPVHLYGQCADMDPIMEIASHFDVEVIEDAAQSLGAHYPSNNGLQHAGKIGKMGCYSFFPTKNLGCVGDAGMIVTNDESLADRLRLLRNHGAERRYYHAMVGGNFRIDALQTAVLSAKLPYLDKWNAMRRKNAAWYDEHFAATDVVTPAIAYQRDQHVYHQYIIAVPNRREELRPHLTECGIGHEVYYPVPLHLQECFVSLGYPRGAFPNSEHAAGHTLALPIYPELTTEMQTAVVEAIAAFFTQ